MFKRASENVLLLLLGGFVGGLLGLLIVNVSSEIGSSRLFNVPMTLIGFIALGTVVAYALLLRKILNQQTTKLASALEVNKTKDEFISMVLHHLRTPLSGIKWSLKSILKQLGTGDQYGTKLQQLYEENDRVLDAVEHLIQVSQASMGRVVYNFELLEVGELQQLIRESIAKLHSMASEKKISISVEMPPASKNSVRGDKEKIATIVQTLIENAVMYTKKEGAIRVQSEEKQSNFFLHISDTGIGIPLKDQSKVFLQFFRSKNASQMQPSGFGIGLFLVKTFLEHHHGEIWFTSKEQKGSTFSFRLPIIESPTEEFLEKISEEQT